jgi:hypothetical protein
MARGFLGGGEYRVAVYERGGLNAVGTAYASQVTWNRGFDKPSSASCLLPISDTGCSVLGKKIVPGVHELGIFRRSSAVGPYKLVWIGPITQITENKQNIKVDALDLLAWLQVLVLRTELRGYEDDLSNTYATLLTDAFSQAPELNITLSVEPCGVLGGMNLFANTIKQADNEMQELLNAAVNVCAIGRNIYVTGSNTISTAPTANLRDEHFLADVEVTEEAWGMATQVYVRGANGLVASYPGVGPTAPYVDPYYGLFERVYEYTQTTDQSTIDEIAQNIYNEKKAPIVTIKIPQGARLSPKAPVMLDELIPGARVDVAFAKRVRVVPRTIFRLDSISVTAGSGGASSGGRATGAASNSQAEAVSITVIPVVVADA